MSSQEIKDVKNVLAYMCMYLKDMEVKLQGECSDTPLHKDNSYMKDERKELLSNLKKLYHNTKALYAVAFAADMNTHPVVNNEEIENG